MADRVIPIPKEELLAKIAPEIENIEQKMREDLQNVTASSDPLLAEILNYGIFNGGKRLRPLLVVFAARLCGWTPKCKIDVYRLAIAFEYLHGATLYHDDVIDRADLRRGKTTVSKEFGSIAAILGGDFLHSRSMFLIGEQGGVEALRIFCRATAAMVDGEFLQLRNAQRYNLSEEDYFAAVKGKTALLIAATCEIGALAGGATVHQQRALADYGLSLGTAFQIIDDLLDYQGDSIKTGKAVGNDFQEGKMTLPFILAVAAADNEDRQRLLSLLEEQEYQEGAFEEVLAIIGKYGSFELCRKKAEKIVEKGVNGLKIFSGKECESILPFLNGLAVYVLARKV